MLHCNMDDPEGPPLQRRPPQPKELPMTNTFSTEQFAAASQANVKALETLAGNAFAGMEKLMDLNLAASKAMLSESFDGISAVLGAKDPQEALAIQASQVQPLAEKSVAYGRHVYAIATESSAEFSKALEGKFAEAQAGFSSLVDNLAKNAPAGSETAMAFFKTTMAASQNAIDSAKVSAKKAADAVQSNLTAVTEQAIKAGAGAYKKA
jgi:phasin family protein